MLRTEGISEMVTIVVATPDGKRDILCIVLRKQSCPASCGFEVLTSLPFP